MSMKTSVYMLDVMVVFRYNPLLKSIDRRNHAKP